MYLQFLTKPANNSDGYFNLIIYILKRLWKKSLFNRIICSAINYSSWWTPICWHSRGEGGSWVYAYFSTIFINVMKDEIFFFTQRIGTSILTTWGHAIYLSNFVGLVECLLLSVRLFLFPPLIKDNMNWIYIQQYQWSKKKKTKICFA